MKGLLKFGAICLLGLGATDAQAQVKFKLTQKEDQKTYVVSMVSEESLNSIKSTTGTGQVTVRVKSEKGFVLSNLQSLDKNAQWDNGATLQSPEGSRDYDYISFNLKDMGTRAIKYTKDKEVELFTFQNNGSGENTQIELIDNEKDPLVAFAKSEFNIRNHMSVLGFGHKNAYTGNLSDPSTDIAKKLHIQKVFPNPAVNETTVQWENLLEDASGDIYLSIVDARTSREISKKKVESRAGKLSIELALNGMREGNYLVYIVKDEVRVGDAQKLIVIK